MHFLDNVIAVMFLSFCVGGMADPLLRLVADYHWLSNQYLFANSKSYERLGVLWFRKLLLATPLRLFNTKIVVTKSRDVQSLKRVRDHIATAEVSHWVALASMLAVTVVAWWYRGSTVGGLYLLCNAFGNLYPCLLQQYNKRRIGSLISALEQRQAVGGA